MKTFISLILFLILVVDGVSEEQNQKASRTVAIINFGSDISKNTADLLTVELSSEKTISLVERDKFKLVSDEIEISKIFESGSERAKAGKILGADFLVLIGADEKNLGGNMVVLVCDSLTGARIGRLEVAAKKIEPRILANALRSIFARFPNGVEKVVAVSDFISRDLGYKFESLQDNLPNLIREELMSRKGLTILEIEEAKEIAREHSLTDEGIQRILPLFIEGEYRTDRHEDGSYTISITVNLKKEDKTETIKSDSIPVEKSGTFIAEKVILKIFSALKEDASTGISIEKQYQQLLERADAFALEGETERAIELREAALLLCPDEHVQRFKLVKEYWRLLSYYNGVSSIFSRHFLGKADQSDYEIDGLKYRISKNSSLEDANSFLLIYRQANRRCHEHFEYLVRNKGIRADEAFDILRSSLLGPGPVHIYSDIIKTHELESAEEELWWLEFIRSISPMLFKLEKNPQAGKFAQQEPSDIATRIPRLVLNGYSPHPGENLELLGDLLCEILPEEALGYDLFVEENLYEIFDKLEKTNEGFKCDAFIDRLKKSDRKILKVYGIRYDLFYLMKSKKLSGKDIDDKLTELVNLMKTSALKSPDKQNEIRSIIDSGIKSLGWRERSVELFPDVFADKKEEKKVVQKKSSREKGYPYIVMFDKVDESTQPVKNPDGSISYGNVLFTPIKDIKFILKDKKSQKESDKSKFYTCFEDIVPAWEGIDAVILRKSYTCSSVFLFDKNLTAREVIPDFNWGPRYIGILPRNRLVFDGKYLWCSSDNSPKGIALIDREGNVSYLSEEHGLPKFSSNIIFYPLSEGRVIVAGQINPLGKKRHSWLGIAEIRNAEPHFEIFHEGKTEPVYSDEGEMLNKDDPSLQFETEDVTARHDDKGKLWIFIDHLIIDSETLDVQISSSHREISWSPEDSLLYRPDIEDVCAYRFALDKKSQITVRNTHPDTNCMALNFFEHNGFLYCHDKNMAYRYNIKSEEKELIIGNFYKLSVITSTGPYWCLGRSNCFGIVALHQDLYKLTFNFPPDDNTVLTTSEPVIDKKLRNTRYIAVDISGEKPEILCLGDSAPADLTTNQKYMTDLIVLRKIPAGKFTMGAPVEESGRDDDEIQHEVTISKDFYIGVFEITQKQYETIMGTNPSLCKGDNLPVQEVNWDMARGGTWPSGEPDPASFVGNLRSKSGGADLFDLPTEAQWEYACRAGTTTALNNGKNSLYPDLAKLGRYGYNQSDKKGGHSFAPTRVGSYLPNAWGLYDMHGNVKEWCLDWYGPYGGNAIDPVGASSYWCRVSRGGAWEYLADNCRSAYRVISYSSGGFRIVLPVK